MSEVANKKTGDALTALREALAHDVLALAVLHNEELSTEMVGRLHKGGFPLDLRLGLVSDRGHEATALMQAGIEAIGENPDQATLDELAADYAGIYLTHALHASPYESVWIDEEGLAMQEPMFQIRAVYERHGLAVQDWRQRSDDHLVLQLQFVSHLFDNAVDLGEVSTFLDEHLLRWLPEFAARVAARSATPFYAGLCIFTAAYMDEMRDLLADVLDKPRPTAEAIEQRLKSVSADTVPLPDPKFIPGSAPSW